MLIWLICHLWNHKTMHKAYTGETIMYTDRITNTLIKVPLHKWERMPYCTRCGQKVHHDEGRKTDAEKQ
jgi:ribosomal protein L33